MYQDHLWWLRSNGLAVLSVGLILMNYGHRKRHDSGQIFHCPQAKNQSASWHRVPWFPSKPCQIIHGMYPDHLWWLKSNGLAVLSVGLMNYDNRKQHELGKIFHCPQAKKQSASWHRVSLDSLLSHAKSFMGYIKMICDYLGAMA
jgi:hypothetical protein